MLASGPFAYAAAIYQPRGWCPIPCCWPSVSGACGCGRGHRGKEIGKAPLPEHDPHVAPSAETVTRWARQYPRANVAMLLAPAQRIVVDTDDPEAEEEVHALGMPRTYTVVTALGHHRHLARPADCPTTRRIRTGVSGRIDILSLGIAVMPPSRHRTGRDYRCLDPTAPIAEAPAWVVQWLTEAPPPVTTAPVELPTELPRVDVDLLAMPGWVRRVILKGTDARYPSRSEAIHAIVRHLVAAGYADKVIAAILLDPRFGISSKPREIGPTWDTARKASRRWVAREIARARAKSRVVVE
jgi:hypothetical protein